MIVWCQLGGLCGTCGDLLVAVGGHSHGDCHKGANQGPALISDVVGRQARLNGIGGKLRGGQYLFASAGALPCDVAVEALWRGCALRGACFLGGDCHPSLATDRVSAGTQDRKRHRKRPAIGCLSRGRNLRSRPRRTKPVVRRGDRRRLCHRNLRLGAAEAPNRPCHGSAPVISAISLRASSSVTMISVPAFLTTLAFLS